MEKYLHFNQNREFAIEVNKEKMIFLMLLQMLHRNQHQHQHISNQQIVAQKMMYQFWSLKKWQSLQIHRDQQE